LRQILRIADRLGQHLLAHGPVDLLAVVPFLWRKVHHRISPLIVCELSTGRPNCIECPVDAGFEISSPDNRRRVTEG
jgi:hypothetical protein